MSGAEVHRGVHISVLQKPTRMAILFVQRRMEGLQGAAEFPV